MGAGKYRERITVLQKGGTPDEAGVKNTWTTYCSRRAEVEPLGGREAMLDRQVTSTVDYLITLRADDTTEAIKASMRVVWNGLTLGIEAVLRKEREREVELACGHTAR